MNDLPLSVLLTVLAVLLAASAFFSGSETGLMTLNRYRLRHRAKKGERAARWAEKLLARPDRLIGLILLANNIVQALAATVTTLIAMRLFGDLGIAIATGVIAFLLLIFSELMPKTLGAIHPERIGLPSAYFYYPMVKVFQPVLWTVNLVSNGLLKIFGVSPEDAAQHPLSSEELRTVVAEAGAMIPERHQRMLLSILDLEKATVEDIMVPRNEIVGVDISQPWESIREQIINSQHTRLPVYMGSIDDLRGVVHLRNAVRFASDNKLTLDNLLALAREPYFIPEGTPLNQQLLNFQNQKRRIGFVVDEYGDIQGLVTLEDILEEVVGDFTSDPATRVKNVYMDPDGSVRVTGAVTLRSINRSLGWKLPTSGPKTVNGLVLEQLEDMPKPGRSLAIKDYVIEITEVRANAVKSARIRKLPPVTETAEAGAAIPEEAPPQG